IMSDSLKQYVQQISSLPTIPVVAQEILKLVHDDLISVDKLENIIRNDPPIAAKIIGAANSAFFGYKTPTQTVNNAIMRIGFNNVRDIALGVSIMTVFENKEVPGAFDYQRIFNHSVTVGLVAQLISRDLKMKFTEEIFLNGILHDLGYLVLNKYFSDTYRNVLDIFEKEGFLIEAEKEVFNFTHADVGAWLAEKWNLPEGLLETVLYHHNPSQAKKNLKRIAVVHIADYIVSRSVFSVTKNNPNYTLDLSSFDALGIQEDYLGKLEEKIQSGDVV
ncbi:MAG: HDOD domain-containing protein, partial [Nitrospiraceae bacterium]